jgi:hypothetical protein
MGAADQKQFTDAVARSKAGGHVNFFGDPYANSDAWVAALNACNRLAMFDMLPAVQAISLKGTEDLEFETVVEMNKDVIGQGAAERIKFACTVVWDREIEDCGVPDNQVNDGREFLGCLAWTTQGFSRRFSTLWPADGRARLASHAAESTKLRGSTFSCLSGGCQEAR